MTDRTYEQTNFFCLALKFPGEDKFDIASSLLAETVEEAEVMAVELKHYEVYDKAEKKIFHVKLIGEVEID